MNTCDLSLASTPFNNNGHRPQRASSDGADDVHKVAKRTKLSDSASGSTTNESMETDYTGKYGYTEDTVLKATSLIKEELSVPKCL